MKYILAFTALVASAFATSETSDCSAAPPAPSSTSEPAPVSSGYFGVISARSASPIHFATLNARGGKFFLGGGGPSSYCPPSIGADNCPPGNTTVLVGGNKLLSMGVVVPGGQQVYVAPDGALSYTVAHSAYIPDGSIVDQFSKQEPTEGKQFGYLNFETGFVACPAGEGQGYQVFGQVQGGKYGDDCLGFDALTVATDKAGAWQY